jgi:L-ascorbate metabolism protein UlaG (beta-lactamase superfamily)
VASNQDEPLSLVLPEDPREAGLRGEGDEWAARFGRGSVQFVGTATVVIRYGGFTILTDPNFLHQGDHVHLGYGLTSPRLTEPAFGIEELPPVDLVLLSHLHGDHFDQVVEEKLDHLLPIVTTPAGARALQRKGFHGARGLETWQRLEVSKGDARLTITSVPARHAPGPLALLLPPVMGSVLDWRPVDGNAPTMRLYVSGDTLLRDELREIPRRFPEIDLALLHLGGTRLFGVLLTMDARQGVEAIRWIRPRRVIPIHTDDYPVFKSPLIDFVREVKAAGLEEQVIYLQRGQIYELEVPRERWSLPVRVHPAPRPAPSPRRG